MKADLNEKQSLSLSFFLSLPSIAVVEQPFLWKVPSRRLRCHIFDVTAERAKRDQFVFMNGEFYEEGRRKQARKEEGENDARYPIERGERK
jgi:hypothetical protein